MSIVIYLMNLTDIFSSTNISTIATVVSAFAAFRVMVFTGIYVNETTNLRKQNEGLAKLQQLQLEEQRKQLDLQRASCLKIVSPNNSSSVYLLNLSDSFVYVLEVKIKNNQRLHFQVDVKEGRREQPTFLEAGLKLF
jgi:hypothetical protein